MAKQLITLHSVATAVAVVVSAAVLRAALHPWLSDSAPFITFFAAVAAAAWYGGWWSAVMAIVLSSVVADCLFIPPFYTLSLLHRDPSAWLEFAAFLAVSGVIVGLSQSMHNARAAVQHQAQRVEQNRKVLQVTLASIGDAVISTDDRGRVTFLNAAAQELTGYSNADAKHQPLSRVFRIVNEQTRQPVEDPCAKVLRTGAVVGLANHTLLISKDGTERPIDDSAAPIFDEFGAIQGVVLVFRDDTARRSAFEASQRLATIVEQSYDAIIGQTNDGTITNWNAAAQRMFGFTAAEAVGRHISLIVPAECHAELSGIMARLKGGGKVDPCDTLRMRKDGSRIDVSLQISPIANAYGEIIGASKIARDATEQKQMQASLALLASTSDTLAALVDPHSVFQQAVAAATPLFADWCAAYRLTADGEFRLESSGHRHPAHEAALAEALASGSPDRITPLISAQALRSGRPQMAFDVAALAAAETALPRELQPRGVLGMPLRHREHVLGVLVFAVTEPDRCYTAQDLPFAEDIARRVATALDNAQLFKSLETAGRQKDEFLAMLAHELRNPLAAIRYALELVRMPEVGPSAEMLDMIDRQVSNLVRMIDDLLDISRISRGKTELRREPLNAVSVVRKAAETVQPLIAEKSHTLYLELPEEALTIDADATRLEQIVGNLLTNAGKYTPAGGRIDLSIRAEDHQAVIEVKDTGMGIGPDVLPHVFELFAQAERALDRSQGGLGIGLTVVKKLTDLHGGSVAADSDGPGRGAKFTVRFPLIAAPATSPDDPGSDGDGVTPAAQRILIVEDNLDTARAEALLLQAHGHIVEVIHNGGEAVDIACRFRPHAMLIDIGLPGLSGYDVASALRQQGLAEVKLIAVSGYGQAEDRERSLAAGFDHHLVKPVACDALFSLLGGAPKA